MPHMGYEYRRYQEFEDLNVVNFLRLNDAEKLDGDNGLNFSRLSLQERRLQSGF